MSKILNLILLLLIIFFYYSFFIYKIKEKSSFFLISFISFVTVITYFLGICNILWLSKIVISIIGLLLFIISFKNIKDNPKQLIHLDVIIYTFICLIWLFFMTRSAGLSHWDDFSHWYRIVKVLNYDNSFPTTSEILYTTYFPGSACFIYFITRFIPFNVANCLFAQGVIVFGCTTSMLSIATNRKLIYKLLVVIIGTILICSINSTFYVLIVDALIGLIALAIFLLIKYNDSKYNSYLVLLLVSFLPLIKAPGILFSIILSIYYLKKNRERNIYKILLFVFPLVLMSMYLIRNSIIYPSISSSNQAISLSRFINIGITKDGSLILDIIKYYLFSLVNIFNSNQIMLIWLSTVIIVINHITDKNNEDYKLVLITLIAYIISLLLVYIFSMDSSEANGTYLACFNRYIGTLAIFLFGILLSNTINRNMTLQIVILCCLFVNTFNFNFLYSHYVDDYTDKMWIDLVNKHEEINTYNTTNYLIIYDENDYPNDITDKVKALGETCLRSNYVYAVKIADIENDNLDSEESSYIESANEVISLSNSQ